MSCEGIGKGSPPKQGRADTVEIFIATITLKYVADVGGEAAALGVHLRVRHSK